MNKNNLFKNILCLIIAILLSFMEAEFFSGTEYYNIALIVLTIVTIPTVFLYFIPRHESMILFLYVTILTYILDLLGRDVDIGLILTTLFFILILFLHSIYTANVEKTNHKKPTYIRYVVLLSIIFILNVFFSYAIYEYVLKPNVNEENQLYISYQDESKSSSDNNQDNKSGEGSSLEIDWIKIIKILIIITLILFLIYYFLKIIKYTIIRIKIKKAYGDRRIFLIYNFVIFIYSQIIIVKKGYNTPYEYENIINENYKEEILLPQNDFNKITELYVLTKYSGENFTENEDEVAYEILKKLVKISKQKIGYRNYFKTIILKINYDKIIYN